MAAAQTIDLIDSAAAEAFIQLAKTTDKFERYENAHAQRENKGEQQPSRPSSPWPTEIRFQRETGRAGPSIVDAAERRGYSLRSAA